jgi:putative transposase
MKPGTFTQMYVHIVFAVQNRDAALREEIRDRVFKYMSGTINNLKHKTIIINGTFNHVHILIGMNPSISTSDTVRDIKRSSSIFINSEKLCPYRFSWQEGYGAFTISRSQIESVYNYIKNQESHHKKISFRDEYIEILDTNEIEFDKQFLFDFWNENN